MGQALKGAPKVVILIDTQALVWLVEGNHRLGAVARRIIDRERAGDVVLITLISVWEVSMLTDKGRLVLSRPVLGWFDAVLAARGFRLADWTVAIAADAGQLPGDIHGDPADRMIIATARALGCPVLTVDRRILDYAEAGHVQAIDARR